MTRAKVLLVGERVNGPMPSDRAEYLADPERWYRVALRAGAFRSHNCRSRLVRVGLDPWDPPGNLEITPMNLEPPAPQDWPMTGKFVREVAALAVRDLESGRWDAAVLCGIRAMAAFGARRLPDTDWGSLLPNLEPLVVASVPHPSGLSRVWNSEEYTELVRIRVSQSLAACAGCGPAACRESQRGG